MSKYSWLSLNAWILLSFTEEVMFLWCSVYVSDLLLSCSHTGPSCVLCVSQVQTPDLQMAPSGYPHVNRSLSSEHNIGDYSDYSTAARLDLDTQDQPAGDSWIWTCLYSLRDMVNHSETALVGVNMPLRSQWLNIWSYWDSTNGCEHAYMLFDTFNPDLLKRHLYVTASTLSVI